MQPTGDLSTQIVVGAALFLAGLLAGLLVSRFGTGPRAQVRRLRREMQDLQDEDARYRSAVARHFTETSEMFRSLTQEYARLYAHLAGGARDLGAENIPALRLEAPAPTADEPSTEAKPAAPPPR